MRSNGNESNKNSEKSNNNPMRAGGYMNFNKDR
jgi:hypothetical protein